MLNIINASASTFIRKDGCLEVIQHITEKRFDITYFRHMLAKESGPRGHPKLRCERWIYLPSSNEFTSYTR